MAADTTHARPLSRTTSFSQNPVTNPRSRIDDPDHTTINTSTIYTPRRRSLDRIYSDLTEPSLLPSNDSSSHHHNDHPQDPIRRSSIVSAFSTTSSTTHATSYPLSQPWRTTLHSLYLQNYGALLVLASQLFGNGMNVTTRLLEQPGAHGPPMHPFQILFARQLLTTICCTLYAVTTKSIPYFPLGPPDRNVRLLLVCRGLSGFFGVFGLYFCLLYLPLSEATVLTFLTPILTCWLCSVVIPGQTFSRQQLLAGLVSLSGVVFIAKPVSLVASFRGGSGSASASAPVTGVETSSIVLMRRLYIVNETVVNGGNGTGGGYTSFEPTIPTPSQHLLAIGIAMVGVCGATLAITSIRAIGTRAHAFVSINYFSVWSTIVSFVALLVIPGISFRMPGNVTEWTLLISIGFCGFVMQGLLTMGLAYGGPAKSGTKDERTMAGSGMSGGRSGGGDDDEDIELQNTTFDVAGTDTTVLSNPKLAVDIGNGSASSSLTPITELRSARPSRASASSPPTSSSSSSSGTRATSMLYTQMLFALFSDKVFFGSVPDVWSWIGSGLILAGAIWVAAARDGGDSGKDGKGEEGGGKEGRRRRRKEVHGTGEEVEVEGVGLLSDVDGNGDGGKDEGSGSNDVSMRRT